MEYQVQINSIKAKLQETRARKKQQEELIMKVENQALKVSSAHISTPFYTHEQGHAGVFMWWKCLLHFTTNAFPHQRLCDGKENRDAKKPEQRRMCKTVTVN